MSVAPVLAPASGVFWPIDIQILTEMFKYHKMSVARPAVWLYNAGSYAVGPFIALLRGVCVGADSL